MSRGIRQRKGFGPMAWLEPMGFARSFVLGLASVVALGLAGCAPSDERVLRVGTHVWPGYETLFLAQEKQFFGAANLKLIELPAASESIRAFENGSVDVATLTLDEVLRLAEKGHEPRIIAVMDFSRGADVVLARPEIRKMADLKGKAIGLELNALGAYLLTRALEQAQLTTRDVTLVPLSIAETETAFQAGRVQAVVTYEPYRTRLLAAGARKLFDSAQIPDEIADVLVARRELVERAPRALAQLVGGHFRAVDYLRAQPDDAARIMARREQLTPVAFLDALKGLHLPDREENARLLATTNTTLPNTLRRLCRAMCEHRILAREVDSAPLRDGRFIANPPK